ncbi:hypothetical protein MMAS_08810 [Mycobacteroides abscessus subsp. massiliense CCUG 48898 = JCM 15300]|nr:hypothetical protein MMAS_08810 [Mycobacteroides abscessus subsp. massiliense CCUG 48898 = JCM 15300]BAP95734.1 hypothetical protein MMASJCM_0958 [Mycobacteroides abscessus subsp. massiliense CCUG 48898 = JCM 15300]
MIVAGSRPHSVHLTDPVNAECTVLWLQCLLHSTVCPQ